MTKLVWDETGERFYETGTKNVVLYPKNSQGTYEKGVAWNGVTAISESPSGAEETPLYANNKKYLSLRSVEEFGMSLEAYTYPDEWAECDGSAILADGITIGQQTRKGFGLCYRTELGNDVEYDSYGYKLHFVWNGMASPSEKSYQTINDSPEAITFSWEIQTTPIDFKPNLKPSATLIIDSSKVSKEKLDAIEALAYGSASEDPKMPMPADIFSIIEAEDQYTAVDPEEGDNPSSKGWYELSNGNYVASTDTTVASGKTYYQKN